jgi:hypothetical protein
VIDGAMPVPDWARFTDFAFTLYDAAGRIVAKEPLNYADVRLRADLPDSLAGQTLTLRLTPAFADTNDTGVWRLAVRIQLLAADPAVLHVAGGEDTRGVTLEAGAHGIIRFDLPAASPWPLPDGFFPLGQGVVMNGDDRWTGTAGLPVPPGPVMR